MVVVTECDVRVAVCDCVSNLKGANSRPYGPLVLDGTAAATPPTPDRMDFLGLTLRRHPEQRNVDAELQAAEPPG